MALPVKMRLRRSADIRRALKTGYRFMSPLGAVSSAKSPFPDARFLFIVSSAVSKKSSERNRIRRQLAEWAQRNAAGKLSGLDIVVLVSSGLNKMPAKEIRARALAMLNGLLAKSRK